MAHISTHVLDTARGRPAAGVSVTLERKDGASFVRVSSGLTDEDGRIRSLSGDLGVSAGTYRLTFALAEYFAAVAQESFFPEAQVTFIVRDVAERLHIPLLLAPFGFTTYRGS